MKRWLTLVAVSLVLSGRAFGQGDVQAPRGLSQHASERERMAGLRLLRNPLTESAPVGEPATSTIGLAVVHAIPKLADDRLYGRVFPSRSAGLRVRLKF